METKVRFGVRSEGGSVSNVWTCWTQPLKGDVYLTSDALGKALKLSDHPTGRSHIAYHYEKRNELFTPETLPKERFILKQEDSERAGVVCTLVACVFFPAGSLHNIPQAAPAGTIWLPEAPEGQATEIGIFRFNVESLPDTWPGRSEGVELVADLPLVGADRLCVVWRHSLFQMPPTLKNTGSSGLFRDRTDEDLLQANRAVIFGTTDAGAISLIETRVTVTRNSIGANDDAVGSDESVSH